VKRNSKQGVSSKTLEAFSPVSDKSYRAYGTISINVSSITTKLFFIYYNLIHHNMFWPLQVEHTAVIFLWRYQQRIRCSIDSTIEK
jgi:hypothetical protein